MRPGRDADLYERVKPTYNGIILQIYQAQVSNTVATAYQLTPAYHLTDRVLPHVLHVMPTESANSYSQIK